jgi:O-antigen/teichoic acid export membrane protein
MDSAEGGANVAAVRRSAFKGAMSGLPSRIAVQLCSFASLALTARILRPEDFGLYVVALTICNGLVLLSESSISNSLVQRPQIDPGHTAVAFWILVWGGLVGFAGLAALSPLIEMLFARKGLAMLVTLMALALPIKMWASVRAALLQRSLKFHIVQAGNLLGAASSLVFTLSAVFLGWGANGLAFGFVMGALAEALWLRYFERTRIGRVKDWSLRHDLLAFGHGYLAGAVANYVATQSPNLLVGHFVGASHLGLLNRANALVLMPVNLMGGVGKKVVFASVARLQSEAEVIGNFLRHSVNLAAILSVPAGIGMSFAAPLIVRVVLGDQWDGAVAVVRILFLVLFARLGYVLPESTMMAMGQIWGAARRQTIYAVMVVVFSTTGAVFGGIVGAAIGISTAVVGFYAISIVAVAALAGDHWGRYIPAHLRGLALAIPCAAASLVVQGRFDGFWGDLAVAVSYWAVFAALLVAAPGVLVGEVVEWRTKMMRKLKLSKPRTAEAA